MRSDLQTKFWLLVAAFGATDGLSFLCFYFPVLMPWVSVGLWLLCVWFGWKRPWILGLIVLAELMVGGQGYLWLLELGGFRLSFRIGLFVILIVLAGIQAWRTKPQFPLLKPGLALLGMTALFSLFGWWQGNGPQAVWLDANGWAYVGVLFAWTAVWPGTKHWKDYVWLVLLSGVTYLAIKTFATAVIFSQQPAFIKTIYHWIRNSGVGEITRVHGSVFRVFFQSHVYGVLVWLAAWVLVLRGRAPIWWCWPLVAAAFSIIMSLSRSFWLGFGAALIMLFIWTLRSPNRRMLRNWILLFPLAGIVWLLVSWTVHWPYIFPPPGISKPSAVATRFSDSQAWQAADARRNQIRPLTQAIIASPIWGYGFGKTLTYYSTDPRVRGWRTTAAFELGYLDLLLKVGILGLAVLGWFAWSMIKIIWRAPSNWVWLSGLVALWVLHLTTPYLNHPLGLGWMALVTVYAYRDQA